MISKEQLEEAERNISDPYWRLNNLYYIIDKHGKKQLFKCNWAQKQLYQNMWYCNIILKARQLGLSTFICLLFLDRCLFNSNVSAGILAHTLEDASHMFKRVKFAYDFLPQEIRSLRQASTDSARELVFSNNSSLRVGTSMRGSTFQYLHISEFGKISATDPNKAREIITGSLNTLAAGQYCFIESTAEGREGYFYDMCKIAQDQQKQNTKLTKLDYRFHFFPWYKDNSYTLEGDVTITKELEDYFKSLEDQEIFLTSQQKSWYSKKQSTQQEDMKREYPSTPDEAFETAITGAYYAKQLDLARIEGRITKVLYDPQLPVHTAWDLGYGDSTAIWVFQVSGRWINLLEYIENSNEPLTYYLKILKSKDYIWGTHLVPHDAAHHEYGSGLTRIETARKNGFHFTLSHDILRDEGIDAVRHMFNRFWFDEEKCSRGILALDNYRRQWNAKQGCWSSSPCHDENSHCADSIRTLATGFDKIEGKGLTEKEAENLINRYLPRFI
jgi:hypothetical protein